MDFSSLFPWHDFFQATIIFEVWINWCQQHFNRCVQPTENPFSWYTFNPNTITQMIFQLKLFCCKMYYDKKSVRYDLRFEFEWHFFGTKQIICTRELTFYIEMSQFTENLTLENWQKIRSELKHFSCVRKQAV